MARRIFGSLNPISSSDDEEEVADYIEQAAIDYYGRRLGNRGRRDGLSGDLRVDFTYDEEEPPAALEVTSLVSPDLKALYSDLRRLEDRLHERAQSEKLGAWLIGFRAGTRVREIEPPLGEFIAREGRRTGSATYSASEAPEDLADDSLRLLTILLDGGLVSALRSDRGHEVSFFPPIVDSSPFPTGFASLLRDRITQKSNQLAEARPRETHLAIVVNRSDISSDPAKTPAPRLPGAIDFLWIVHGYYSAKYTYRLWRTSGDGRWHLLRHPLNDRPVF